MSGQRTPAAIALLGGTATTTISSPPVTSLERLGNLSDAELELIGRVVALKTSWGRVRLFGMGVGVVATAGLLYAFGSSVGVFGLLPLVAAVVAPKLRKRGAVAELTAEGFSAEAAAALASAGEAVSSAGERHSPRELGARAVAVVLAAKPS